jgi:ABC-type dipeptide/oligopeptide/nickel transport system permease component
MAAHLVRRLLRMLFVIWGVSLVAFVFLRLSGDPASVMLPFDSTAEDRQRVREAFGLDKPVVEQYGIFISRAIHGDFGQSLRYRQPALQLVLERYPNTLELALVAMLLVLGIGIPLGFLSAVHEGTWLDFVGVNLALLLQSMPSFWLGIMLIIVFAVQLGWLPTAGKSGPESVLLPAFTLASVFLPQILLLVRSGIAEALQEDYVRTARAKGLTGRVIHLRHTLPNILIPLVTVIGLNFGVLLGGSVVTETVFSWPGVGLLAIEGVYARDFPLVQAAIFTLSLGIVLMNLCVDLLYGVLDPRVRRI